MSRTLGLATGRWEAPPQQQLGLRTGRGQWQRVWEGASPPPAAGSHGGAGGTPQLVPSHPGELVKALAAWPSSLPVALPHQGNGQGPRRAGAEPEQVSQSLVIFFGESSGLPLSRYSSQLQGPASGTLGLLFQPPTNYLMLKRIRHLAGEVTLSMGMQRQEVLDPSLLPPLQWGGLEAVFFFFSFPSPPLPLAAS